MKSSRILHKNTINVCLTTSSHNNSKILKTKLWKIFISLKNVKILSQRTCGLTVMDIQISSRNQALPWLFQTLVLINLHLYSICKMQQEALSKKTINVHFKDEIYLWLLSSNRIYQKLYSKKI
jgi:hypothetical protein